MNKSLSLLLSLAALLALAALAFALMDAPKAAHRAGPHLIALVQLTEVDDETAAGFRRGMTELGYREGEDVRYLGAGPVGRRELLAGAVRAQLQQQPDLVFVSSTPATQEVKRQTGQLRQPPVVFAPVNDPVGAGIVDELRHPGGHITGVRLPTGDDLRLKWLLRIAPKVKRVYLPYSLDDKSALASVQQAKAAATMLGVTLLPHAVTVEQIDAAIAALPNEADAIFLPRDSRIEARIADFVALAERRRLPLSAPSLIQTRAGALFSYGFVHHEIGLQAARLADQILKGQAAGDLPVEMAENRLAINLVAAQRIGLDIADDILRQAEYVIRE